MGQIDYEGWNPPHVSHSTLSTYRMCGAKVRFEKVFRLEQIPGLAAIGGNAVHVASELIDAYVLEHGIEALESEDIIELDINNN